MSHIKNGAIISYFSILFSIIAGLLYTPWLVNKIGSSNYGLYALIGAYLSYFIIDFGIGSAIAKFLSEYRIKKDLENINKFLSTTLLIYLLIDLFILIIIILSYFLLSDIFLSLNKNELETLKIIYSIAAIFSILNFPFLIQNGILLAYEKFVYVRVIDLICKILIISITVLAINLKQGIYSLVLINGLISFIISILKYFYIKKNFKFSINVKLFHSTIAKNIFKFSIWAFIISVAQRLLINAAPTIIGIYSGTTQIAIFAIALSFEAYIWTFANALNGLFIPKLTKFKIENQSKKVILELMIKVGRIQLLVIGFFIIFFIIFGKSFINLWMGKNYTESYYVALLLICPGIITLTQEIALSLLFVESKLKYRAYLFLFASIISIIVGCVLAPTYGAFGTAIGIVVALIICHVIGMNIVYYKVLKLNILHFFKQCHLKLIIPVSLVTSISYILQTLFPVNSWNLFILHSILFTCLFYFFSWIFFMNNFEKITIKKTLLSIKIK